ncbi:MAG: Uma2 family endonuclease [Cyanobacteria bacterium CRU_2_1]|nr:Uma2 family endonuclease [Cyanobacteria bacterium RU_5_0]NJR60181.1 Uma2 family endonuclease [Cyanobacteria bacterium CRU_2_1]
MSSATQTLTLEAFLRLPEIEASPAWELIDGEMVQKPMPTTHHSILQKRLVAVIDGAESPYEAFPELRCVLSQQSVVPDVAVILSQRVLSENSLVQGAPDWMIEILSPDQSTTKLIAKIQACLMEGTQLGWLLDSAEGVIMVFWSDRPLAMISGDTIVPVLPGIDLQITAKRIFDWLQPQSRV